MKKFLSAIFVTAIMLSLLVSLGIQTSSEEITGKALWVFDLSTSAGYEKHFPWTDASHGYPRLDDNATKVTGSKRLEIDLSANTSEAEGGDNPDSKMLVNTIAPQTNYMLITLKNDMGTKYIEPRTAIYGNQWSETGYYVKLYENGGDYYTAIVPVTKDCVLFRQYLYSVSHVAIYIPFANEGDTLHIREIALVDTFDNAKEYSKNLITAGKSAGFYETTREASAPDEGYKGVIFGLGEAETVTVTVTSADSNMGTVSSSDTTYEVGSKVTVTATPAMGYSFVNWTNADGEVVSTDIEYTFNVTEAVSLTANFEHTGLLWVFDLSSEDGFAKYKEGTNGEPEFDSGEKAAKYKTASSINMNLCANSSEEIGGENPDTHILIDDVAPNTKYMLVTMKNSTGVKYIGHNTRKYKEGWGDQTQEYLSIFEGMGEYYTIIIPVTKDTLLNRLSYYHQSHLEIVIPATSTDNEYTYVREVALLDSLYAAKEYCNQLVLNGKSAGYYETERLSYVPTVGYTGEIYTGGAFDEGEVYSEVSLYTLQTYIDATDALINTIEKKETPAFSAAGNIYYVSSSSTATSANGSIDAPFKTIEQVNSAKLSAGDIVYFKRGDTFRSEVALSTKSGVTYSAYGEGAKPKILRSIDVTGADKWTNVSGNIWMYKDVIPAQSNVGQIVFDGGDAWGIMRQLESIDGGKRWLDIGDVFNGIESYTTKTVLYSEGSFDHFSDLEFYHDIINDSDEIDNGESGRLYICSTNGNPGTRFETAEMALKGHGIYIPNNAENIVIDNIEVCGAGAHGVSAGDLSNVTVQNCSFKWIGGSIQTFNMGSGTYGVRFGNAVESYGASTNFVMKDNYAVQVYDCAWTAQYAGTEAKVIDGLVMTGNVAEFCNTGLEVWARNGCTVKNIDIHGNHTRYSGYGWQNQRPNKVGNFFYGDRNTDVTYQNNNVYENINYISSVYALKVAATGTSQYNFHDNIYIMERGKKLGFMSENPGAGTGNVVDIYYTKANIEAAVATGFEAGGKFYLVKTNVLGDNMYDLYVPEGEDKPVRITYGDVNDDGAVDLSDIVALSRYVANWVDVEIILENSDVDQSGIIDLTDSIVLSRHIAAWTGYESLPIK